MLVKTSRWRINPETGKKEFWFECPNMCHGFGVCSYCADLLGAWDILRPHFTSRSAPSLAGNRRFGGGGCF